MELETERPEVRQRTRMALTEGELRGLQEPVETGLKNWQICEEDAGEGGWEGTQKDQEIQGWTEPMR